MKRFLFLMFAAAALLHAGCGKATPTLSQEELQKREAESKASMEKGMEAMKGAMKQINAGKTNK